ATGYWLLATGYWLLATGYWLLEKPMTIALARKTAPAKRISRPRIACAASRQRFQHGRHTK
ncbi:hypothetical protein, partial [Acetobacter sp.]|uniref:hypothetical protein n=1 Tax=Acetobacter sp. TaxID=440 RepID=UPI0039ECBDD6